MRYAVEHDGVYRGNHEADEVYVKDGHLVLRLFNDEVVAMYPPGEWDKVERLPEE